MRALARLFPWLDPKHNAPAAALYARAVEKARAPEFYAQLGAPDTVEGRFDVIVVHVHMLLRRLRGEGAAAADLSQRIFDVMFKDMDASLRELGVGDLVISKRIRNLASAFYGRTQRYDDALEADDARAALEEALALNVCVARPEAAGLVADYVLRQSEALRAAPLADFLAGAAEFGAPVLSEGPR